jgi:dCMP deaminase
MVDLKPRALVCPSRKWDLRFLSLAREISSWSKDPSTKVGAVVVGPSRDVRTQGYNGFPRGVLDDASRYANRPLKYRYVVHAELNACLHAARTGVSLCGCSMYITLPPCAICAGAIIQVGIVEIVHPSCEVPERWRSDFELARDMLLEAKVRVQAVSLSDWPLT